MLIQSRDTLEEVLSSVIHEIHRGALDKKHPFRYSILSTVYKGMPESRYIVLREVDDEDLACYFHTDGRSDKVSEIKNNNSASVLLYHPSKKVQIRLKGKAFFDNEKKEIWANMSADAKKAYTSKKAPGEVINSPESGWEWDDEAKSEYFTIIRFVPSEMEILQLSGQEHLRAQFTRNEKLWDSVWLQP